ncbi:hypothetical protein B0A48_01841 [Cryoendolithus antarcticus]|uniref:chitinase n=1 Tax=Cryoendolithus antarcticus TaxID=1507870 RepID=A0A1V8TQV6_9PEZI|nr:hypothetical protein B0A48_01841 [Cryoendolithus antarcticus]
MSCQPPSIATIAVRVAAPSLQSKADKNGFLAKSECGQYADPPGKDCPLNVCCSEFGFCGATEEFCTGKCQSNCVVDPPVPAGGSGITVLNNRVIGYYEAWAARRTCRTFPPSGIPTEDLTHVNFAFANVEPGTYRVVPMDSATPENLFAETTDVKTLKSRNSNLEVFISLGGWTYSDNGTSTQAVFPEIASDPAKRQKFADNLVSFMVRYGFDGVDLDWEYPGAPDRGGNEEKDIQNFVELLKTLRSTFLSSARGNYGLTFTAPTSYWYLRWFDIPQALKYADWVNLMSYDLHGIWDAHNPIGSIIQAHTNLTEIKLAVDLLWRNNVPPGQVVIGPCTNSAGTLAYFEIMDIIADQKPDVVHDKDAAANYIVFGDNKDQWVSYDDAVTFKQKVDWANSVGLGGVMVWSVDQDDEQFSALEGFLGESIPSFEANLKRKETADTDHWSSVNGQACKVSDCLTEYANPPSGFSIAPNGKFPDKCGKNSWGQMYKSANGVAQDPATGSVTKAKRLLPTAHTVTNRASSQANRPSVALTPIIAYKFEGCHWVGKGTCDDNECSASDVQVGLDPEGDTGNYCAGGFSSRQKPLCCNTPDNLNPFLPVPLENLFPTLPPTTDIPAFDKQTLSQTPSLVGENPNPNAFFFVVIDGPPGSVKNLNKRDGSHLEFLSPAVHQGQAAQTTHFICMIDSDESNCDDLHFEGVEGSIIRMPDDLGYDFSKVKRADDPVYMRVDYATSNKYYTDVVEAAHQKRELHPRFWSKISSIWKTITQNIRSQTYDSTTQPTIKKDNFNVLLYGDDGADCGDGDGFLKMNLAGSMRDIMRFGFTLVGTVQPFALEEAFGYFDSDIYMSGQLSFDGKGVLNIGNNGGGATRKLFSSPVSGFQASHPGIVSFSPELNADISLVGKGGIDGKFSVNFEAGSSKTMTTNAPPGLGTFDGGTLNNALKDAVDGYLSVDDPTFNTIFAMNMNLETKMELKIFGYESTTLEAGATFTARTPHAIRIVGDGGTGKPAIIDAPQGASSEGFQSGTVLSGWDDGTTHAIGSQPSPLEVFTGGEAPPTPHKVPDIKGYAIFGDKDFMTCGSKGSYSGELVCTYLLINNDSSLIEPDPPYRLRSRAFRREFLEPLSQAEHEYHVLQKRAPGPSGGSANTYYIYEYPPPVNGAAPRGFRYDTPTYPAGNNGAALDVENGHTAVTANGVQGVDRNDVDAEHPEDRSIFPNHNANFFQAGELGLADGQGGVFRTNLPMFTFDQLLNFAANDYRTWVHATVEANPPPGSALGDIADAHGSTTNAVSMSNLERNLNILKGRMYTTEGLPTSNDQFDFWLAHPGQGTAEAAFSALSAVFGVFNYINTIRTDRADVEAAIQTALQQFDNLYARTFPNRPERLAPLRVQFRAAWLRRVTNFATRYVRQRLTQLRNVYQPLAAPNSPQLQLANDVLAAITRMEQRVTNNELTFQ